MLDLFSTVDDSNDNADGPDRRENDDLAGLNSDDPGNNNGNGSRNMDVDDSDGHASTSNERERINPFSNRNRNNFNSGNDNSSHSPALIVNTNLLPFIQKLRDPLRMYILCSSHRLNNC